MARSWQSEAHDDTEVAQAKMSVTNLRSKEGQFQHMVVGQLASHLQKMKLLEMHKPQLKANHRRNASTRRHRGNPYDLGLVHRL